MDRGERGLADDGFGGVVALCRDLGIQAIAEGVETQAQHDMLQELDAFLAWLAAVTRP